jgi:hypothetical protein
MVSFVGCCGAQMANWQTEIDPEVDFDSRRAVYFRQMRYGLFVRITFVFKEWELTGLTDPDGPSCKHHGVIEVVDVYRGCTRDLVVF